MLAEAGAEGVEHDEDVTILADGGPQSPSPYSVGRQRARLQLDAAMACNTLEFAVPRLERALEEAAKLELDGLAPYIDVLEELRFRMGSLAYAQNLGLPSQPPPALHLQTITPRLLPQSPSEVRARIELQAAGVVGMLTLTDEGIAELRDAADPGVVVRSAKIFDPNNFRGSWSSYPVIQSASRLRGLPRESFDHIALEEFLDDPSMPFARLVGLVDPMQMGSLLLASQLLRGGPQARLNGVVYALPGTSTEASMAGAQNAALSAFLSLGGEDLGIGRGKSGCLFQRAVVIVERTVAHAAGWPNSVALLAFQVAAVGTQVEESPALGGQWIFEPADLAPEEKPGKPEAPKVEGGEGEEPPPPPQEEGEQEANENKPQPPELYRVAVEVHRWLWKGLDECYKAENRSICIDPFCNEGVMETESFGGFAWLERTEQAGYWGPVRGVFAERVQQDKDQVQMVYEERRSRKEEKRQAKALEEALKAQAEADAAAAAEAANNPLAEEAVE